MVRLIGWLMLAGCLVGCAGMGGGVDRAKERDRVYEAALRGVFELTRQSVLASDQPGLGEGFYVTIEGGDPGEPFMERFWYDVPIVDKGSRWHRGMGGVQVSLGEIRWIDGDRAQVPAEIGTGEEVEKTLLEVSRRWGRWKAELEEGIGSQEGNGNSEFGSEESELGLSNGE